MFQHDPGYAPSLAKRDRKGTLVRPNWPLKGGEKESQYLSQGAEGGPGVGVRGMGVLELPEPKQYLLDKSKKGRMLAFEHLLHTVRISSQFGLTFSGMFELFFLWISECSFYRIHSPSLLAVNGVTQPFFFKSRYGQNYV